MGGDMGSGEFTSEELISECADPVALVPFVPRAARRILVCGGRAGVLPGALAGRADAAVACWPEGGNVPGGPIEAAPLPFADDYFDCILAADLLARLREPEVVLCELRRVLAPGGLLIATAPNLQYFGTVFMVLQGRWAYADKGILARGHVRFFTGVEVAELLDAAKFEVRSLSSLVLADPSRLPRDADGCIRADRIRVGPLNDTEYQIYRTSQFVALAVKSDAPAAALGPS
ncbi:MAG TPA: methyltransferase domain-containing protein [Candidatus Hydrogenedentes bacterium]|nr:methyltransferase domain-containing protein [Candidatus Hydrogenedentota bacterium]